MILEHIERRTSHSLVHHPIPEMTDPLGSGWRQPSRGDIEIDSDSALMSQASFDLLPEYSATNPSGVYPGKMRKRHDGSFDRAFLARGGKPVWLLCWYDFSERGLEWCATRSRRILIV